MLVDSHCHLDRLDLEPFGGRMEGVLDTAREQGVGHFLCVSINMEDYPAMFRIAEAHEQISASVGLHPNEQGVMIRILTSWSSWQRIPRWLPLVRPASIISAARVTWTGSVTASVVTSLPRRFQGNR